MGPTETRTDSGTGDPCRQLNRTISGLVPNFVSKTRVKTLIVTRTVVWLAGPRIVICPA